MVHGIVHRSPSRFAVCSSLLVIALALTAWTMADTFPVTKITDSFDGVCDADCSLREAIQAANNTPGADVVTLPAGNHRLSITGAGEDANATGDLDILETVEIVGAGEGLTHIDGSASSLGDRIFDIRVGPVEISDLTINGGKALGGTADKDGGGIRNLYELTLRRCSITNNEAANSGGGIYTGLDSTLLMIDSSVVDNESDIGGGIGNWGGEVHLTNCEVMNNTAGSTAGSNGGGIRTTGALVPATGGDLTIEGSTISGNTSSDWGGGVFIQEASAIIIDTSIIGNTADGAGGIHMGIGAQLDLIRGSVSYNYGNLGGGLFARNGLDLRGATFEQNTGREGAAIYIDYGDGGMSPVPIADATFTGNIVNVEPGSVVHVTTGTRIVGCTFTGNHGGSSVYVDSGAWLKLLNSTFDSNTGADAAVNVAATGSATIRSSTIVRNTATAEPFGGLNGPIDIANSIVAHSVATQDCNGTFITSSGYNIESGTSCGFTATGDQQSTDPMVSTLADNGGPTQTLSLLIGSPAIDGGDPAGCDNGQGGTGILYVDQRSYLREFDGDGNGSVICDVGALEVGSIDSFLFGDDFETGDLTGWDGSAP